MVFIDRRIILARICCLVAICHSKAKSHCSSDESTSDCLARSTGRPAQQREHLLLQRSHHHSVSDCTPKDADPWVTGEFRECCAGTKAELGQWHGAAQKYYLCRSSLFFEPEVVTTASQKLEYFFEAADGGEGRVCRGRTKTDNRAAYFSVVKSESLEDCQSQCRATPKCRGIEFNLGASRCEVWTLHEGIGVTLPAAGYTCMRYVPKAEFLPVSQDSDNTACRGADKNDNLPSHYKLIRRTRSLQACKNHCFDTAGCQGIEYKAVGWRCEVWTRKGGIQATRPARGYTCLKLDTNCASCNSPITLPTTTPVPCTEGTPAGQDRYAGQGQCCPGLVECTEIRPQSDPYFCTSDKDPNKGECWLDVVMCRQQCSAVPAPMPMPTAPTPTPTPIPVPSIPGQPGDTSSIKLLQWNVHWENKNTAAIANIIKPNKADIIGLCELTTSMQDMATALTDATGRTYQVQPGHYGWQGYGTDIFYDAAKWEAVEGGVRRAACSGSRGGHRASNWVVLKSLQTEAKLIVGGTHTSYCAGGCDELHECELGEMYNRLDEMRAKYPGTPVIWIGDTNRDMHTRIMRNILQGKLGTRLTFKVDDLAKTRTNTYYTGGTPVDHILGEHGAFMVQSGGSTGQGVTGQHLAGADHFPVFAEVIMN
eukprot:TRINITY_DN2503_c0_g1_i1.p1 TRINITY_DN2503_c0_g1~~TRINITY_DN2503_c0_g1_i1.p1  ORF type:complete len:674 (-),score=70.85 TRINITY_DN2503_c0_g1_i1:273-2225(-)